MTVTTEGGLEKSDTKASGPLFDADEERRARKRRTEEIAKYVIPLAVMALALWYWDRLVVWNGVQKGIMRVQNQRHQWQLVVVW